MQQLESRARSRLLDMCLVVVLLATSPLALLSALSFVNAVNPFQTWFLTPLEIVNRSGRRVEVTPIGAWEGTGQRGALPLSISNWIAFEAPRRGNFALGDGDSIHLVYDWDDINLTDIVVKDEFGNIRSLVIDDDPPLHGMYARGGPHVIPNFGTVPRGLGDLALQSRSAAVDEAQTECRTRCPMDSYLACTRKLARSSFRHATAARSWQICR